jgi:isocitrate dehydrogenase
MYTVSKEEQIKELENRIPPIVNIDLVIFRKDKNDAYSSPEFLVGRKDLSVNKKRIVEWIFP